MRNLFAKLYNLSYTINQILELRGNMIEIIEVKTKKEIREFVDFPTKLYKGVKQYVHPLRFDEINNFNPKKNASLEECDVQLFLAKQDGKIVGRIAGIIQRSYNKKVGQTRCRFSRFDAINDVEVARALFGAVENWAREQGMNIVHGPLGFNDLDREGMLIEGFDEVATFEEQYNFPYYKDLLEACGYEKETDWLEYKIFPSPLDERTDRIADMVLKRYNLRVVQEKSKKKFLKKYGDQLFEVIDQAYAPLHGTVPLSESVRAQILEQFELILSLKFFIAIVDENDRVIAFGFALPSLAKAVNKSKGKMWAAGVLGMLQAVKKPQVVDLALVGIRPEYQGKGVNAIIMRFMANSIKKNHIQFCETNLNLEDNIKIQQQWKLFNHSQHKRRRCFIKKLDN